MPYTVLLTGIAGSIGIHCFTRIMNETVWDVVGIDSFRHMGWSDRVVDVLTENPQWRFRLKVFTHDLSAPISPVLADRIGSVQAIINMAALSDVQVSIATPYPFIVTNIQEACTMLDYARQVRPEVFVQISTDEVYGPTDGLVRHSEWDRIVPSNPYAASKAAQEAIAISYWRTYKVPLIIANVMNNFGERQSPNKFPAIVQRKLMNDETVSVHGSHTECGTRYYTHSQNTADALIYLIQNTTPKLHSPGRVDYPDRYNIVGDKQIDNTSLVHEIARILGKNPVIVYEPFDKSRPGHDRHYGLNGDKMRGIGWKPPLTFEEGLRQTVLWQKEHPEWLVPASS